MLDCLNCDFLNNNGIIERMKSGIYWNEYLGKKLLMFFDLIL